jgi:hypothetical protein
MLKRPSWYDPEFHTSPFLTALAEMRRICCQAEFTVPYTRSPGGFASVEALKDAIDAWAEHEMGARDFFYGRGHGIGCKHT